MKALLAAVLAALSLYQASAQQRSSELMRREVHHATIQRHVVEPEGVVLQEAKEIQLVSASAREAQPLKSGMPLKIRNRKLDVYLGACRGCNGVLQQAFEEKESGGQRAMTNSCPSLLAGGQPGGCLFAMKSCLASTFHIEKYGFPSGTPIHSGDLVLLKSLPSTDGDSDFQAYVGTCGSAGGEDTSNGKDCSDSSAVTRLYDGRTEVQPSQHHVMWTIFNENAEGPLVLGQDIKFSKAARTADDDNAGTYLSVCSMNATGGKCGARHNVYTRLWKKDKQEENIAAQWILEVSSKERCADPSDSELQGLHPGDGKVPSEEDGESENPTSEDGGKSEATEGGDSKNAPSEEGGDSESTTGEDGGDTVSDDDGFPDDMPAFDPNAGLKGGDSESTTSEDGGDKEGGHDDADTQALPARDAADSEVDG